MRDEATSFHYQSPGNCIEAPEGVPDFLEKELKRLGRSVRSGPVWTTDAPYRETRRQLETHAAAGVLAVEMQAASLFSFALRLKFPVAVVASQQRRGPHRRSL